MITITERNVVAVDVAIDVADDVAIDITIVRTGGILVLQ